MKSKIATHTPGPWELSGGNTSVWAISPPNARVRIADIRQHSPMNGVDNEANARLIAAAPELLEACKWADRVIQDFRGQVRTEVMSDVALSKLKAAIAKAEAK